MSKGKAKAAVKNAGKKATAAVKKTAAKAKTAAKHPIDVLKKAATQVKKGAVKVADKAKDAAEWAVLLPFKPVMVKALEKKHVSVSKKASIKTIAALFFVNIIVPASKTSKLEEHVDENKAEDAAFAAAKIAATATGIPPQSVDIVHAILDFLKGLGKKKNKEDEKKGADDVTDKEAGLIAAANESAPAVEKDAPLTDDHKEIAEDVVKVTDKLAETIPDTKNSDGEVPKPGPATNRQHRGVLHLFGIKY